MLDLVIVGCGGFGREVAELVEAINSTSPTDATPWNLLGFIDDAPSASNLDRVRELGYRVLGNTAMLPDLTNSHYVVGIGLPHIRKALAHNCDSAGLKAATLVHPTARLGRTVVLGEGTIVCGGASLTTNIQLGRHVQVNPQATIGHDSKIADFVTVTPMVTVSGDCTIGELSFVGTQAAILPGVTVGSSTLIGAGACVVDNVADGLTVKGVPAR